MTQTAREEKIETSQTRNAMKTAVLYEVLTWIVVSLETFQVD